MYVKLNSNGAVDTFPYSLLELRKDHPSISFPREMPQDLLTSYNVFPVVQLEKPDYDKRTETIEAQTTPVQNAEGVWEIGYTVTPKTQEAVDEYDFVQGINTRIVRNRKLTDSDWIVTRALEEGTSVPTEWSTYRQALRDITDHANFPYLTEDDWPSKP